MTPKFWKYLINNCHGSTIRFVAEQDRDRAEKELEGDARLLSYHAKPQIQSSVFRRPTERVLGSFSGHEYTYKQGRSTKCTMPLSPSTTRTGQRTEEQTGRWLTCDCLIQTTAAQNHG